MWQPVPGDRAEDTGDGTTESKQNGDEERDEPAERRAAAENCHETRVHATRCENTENLWAHSAVRATLTSCGCSWSRTRRDWLTRCGVVCPLTGSPWTSPATVPPGSSSREKKASTR